jgi:hypothetical protein
MMVTGRCSGWATQPGNAARSHPEMVEILNTAWS